MSDFSGYEKMPDSLKKAGLNENDLSKLDKLKWVVTEKIHGANFSFSYENNTLKYAKRREYLAWGDDFFGFQLVVNTLESNMISLFEHLNAAIPGNRYIVYGELFGGKYPHPEVSVAEHLQAIQTGVYYAPDIHFSAFDIGIVNDQGIKYYLDYETAVSYFEQFGIPYIKPLLIGKFNEALNFNIRINSPVPIQQFGLPALEQNLIEGVVIKPYNLKNTELLSNRPIIKLKNPEFDEEEKFHKAEKWSFIPDISSKTESLSFIIDELRTYVSKNRLESVISKIGALDINNPLRVSEIKSEFSQDILTDFNENNGNLLEELSQEDKEWITERLNSEIQRIIFIAAKEK
ncbi:RNA ligase family protein [Chryseobacterium bernardetii]|uniref:RNA ligase family protein n=1 Tax=Chryseobacterium bernardetii TaxID=1241978 RepID=UPI000F512003|nr:RNA ligase family protein [Chryseobacterium bernardetii]AZB32790.1 2'-5' RNA ligase [Chryseobacterium bernardetii]